MGRSVNCMIVAILAVKPSEMKFLFLIPVLLLSANVKAQSDSLTQGDREVQTGFVCQVIGSALIIASPYCKPKSENSADPNLDKAIFAFGAMINFVGCLTSCQGAYKNLTAGPLPSGNIGIAYRF
jgi:hypothetical protein